MRLAILPSDEISYICHQTRLAPRPTAPNDPSVIYQMQVHLGRRSSYKRLSDEERLTFSDGWPLLTSCRFGLCRPLVLLSVLQFGDNLATMAIRIVVISVIAGFLLASLFSTMGISVFILIEVVFVVLVEMGFRHLLFSSVE